jgi:NADH-quinone oxidoreductase subunit K
MFLFFLFTLCLFIISWFGMFLSRQHFILILIFLEIMLLAVNFNFVCFSVFYDDFFGQIYSFFVLTIAAGESALGLALLVVYYRLRGGIAVSLLTLLKS